MHATARAIGLRPKALVLLLTISVGSLTWLAGTATPAGAEERPVLQDLCGLVSYTPLFGQAGDTAVGPDGNIWLGELAGIVRLTHDGVATTFGGGFPVGNLVNALTAGPDGNMWFVLPQPPARVGKVTMEGEITIFSEGIVPNARPLDITAGPDGNVWLPSPATSELLRVEPDGTITPFGLGADLPNLSSIATGADGKLWFSYRGGIGNMTPAGAVTLITDGVASGSVLFDFVEAPDGNLWFGVLHGPTRGAVGRITPDGDIVQYPVPDPVFPPDVAAVLGTQFDLLPTVTDLVLAPDGTLYFSSQFTGQIGRVTLDGQITFLPSIVPDELLPDWLFDAFPPLRGYDEGDGTHQLSFLEVADHLAGIALQVRGLSVTADGNLWFISGDPSQAITGGVARLTPEGAFRLFNSGVQGYSIGGVTAPDGTFWYAGLQSIGNVSPEGVTTNFRLRAAALGVAQDIAYGADGNLWFADVNSVARMTPDGEITRFTDGSTAGIFPYRITAGPDGNVWFTERGTGRVGRVTVAGEVTMFATGLTGVPLGIAAGGDGNVWFTLADGPAVKRLGRITPEGVVTEFDVGGFVGPDDGISDLTGGPDGNVWFTAVVGATGKIGRITPDGTVTMFEIPSGFDLEQPTSIAAVGDAVWFTLYRFQDDGSDLQEGLDGGLGRITTDGEVTLFDTTPPNVGTLPGQVVLAPSYVTGLPDGTIWLTRLGFAGLAQATVPDEVGEPCDHDEDGDSHSDFADVFPTDPREWADGDKDLAGDNGDAFPFDPHEWLDTDGDHIGNNADLDDDADGLPDAQDPKPLDPDTDDDGRLDGADNCVSNANPNQADADHDGIGDVCDRTVFVQLAKRTGFSLQAKLVDGGGLPVKGATITFTNRLGGKICTATTDRNGKARCGFPIGLLIRILGGYRATFAGDALHDPASTKTWR